MILRLSGLLGAAIVGLALGGVAASCSELPEARPEPDPLEGGRIPHASPFDRLPAWVIREPYPVDGRSRSEISQALRDSLVAMPGQPDHRHFGAVTASRYSFDAIDTIGIVESCRPITEDSCECTATAPLGVRLEITMHYPIWTDMATCSDKALVSDWQTYISALFLHELGHLHIARAGLVHLRTQLNTLAIVETAPTCGEACAAARSAISHRTEQAIDDLVEEIEQAHRDYDRRTEHGRRQGAEF